MPWPAMSLPRAARETLLDAYELRIRTSKTGLLVPAHHLHVRPRVPTLTDDFLAAGDVDVLSDEDIIESTPLDPRVMESGVRERGGQSGPSTRPWTNCRT